MAAASIVILGSDAVSRRAMHLVLQGHGFSVRSYATPDPLIEGGLMTDAACLIVDGTPSDPGGTAVLKAVRRVGGQMPAILVSEIADDSLVEGARSSGFADVLRKPVHADALMRAVVRLLGRKAGQGIRNAGQKDPDPS